MKKREQLSNNYYPDIFEPPPPIWRTSITQATNVNNTSNSNRNKNNSNDNYYTHSPRSPTLHHRPSLTEFSYHDLNPNANLQGAYQETYQEQYPHNKQRKAYYKKQYSNDQIETEEHKDHHSYRTIRRDSIESNEIHDYQSASSSLLLPTSNSPFVDYDSDKDEEKNTNILNRSDTESIANSLFTAIDQYDNTNNGDDQDNDNDDDDDDSIDNIRHGYLPNQPNSPTLDTLVIQDFKNKLNLTYISDWEDYKPQYTLLNDSYNKVKKDVYNEIYSTLQKIQELDNKFNVMKAEFQLNLYKNYEQMSNNIISQCNDLSKQKEEYLAKSKFESNTQTQFKSEKIRLNVGGQIFETSLSTLRRDNSSLLAIMFSGRHLIIPESDGSYFIDRDPSHFRYVLNYLRDLRVPPAILKDTQIRQELLQEAKYYCINGLVNTLSQ